MKTRLSSKKILVVDDEAGISNLLQLWLRRQGYEALTASTGAEGVRAAAHHSLFAAFVDLTLRDMSGFEVLTQIRKIHPNLPVVIITGSREETDARRALELGALDYITKPVDFNYLLRILDLQKAA